MARAYAVRVGTPPSTVAAPTGPFTLGTQVGVPTGASLTASSGLGANDGSESLTITHPVSGATANLTVTVYRRRRWTATPSANPGLGATFLFDECEFAVASDNFCFDNDTATNARNDLMAPLVVFRRCSFNGSNLTGKAIVGGYLWLDRCDLRGCEDGLAGAYWSVVKGSNIVAATDGLPDPHSDGVQIAAIGQSVFYNNWLSGGTDPASANAPLRLGTEFSAVTNVDIRYNGFAGVAHGLQVRGDAGAGDISNVTVIGNRWVNEQLYGPTDFAETTAVTWSDNAFFGGASIPNPVP